MKHTNGKHTLLGGLAVATAIVGMSLYAGDVAANKYVGVKKCKKCHSGKDKGGQYHVWKKMKHANAFNVLASPEAKKVGAKHGIKNPQTDAKCLKCHETAYGEPKSRLARTFKPHNGVQCESCHGMGDKHFKARFRAEQEADDDGGWDEGSPPAKVPVGELAVVNENTCRGCHNKKSPSFKEFKFLERCKKIAHLDPRKGKARIPCK